MDGRPSRETWPSWPSSSDPSVCVCQDGWEAFQRDMAILAFFERPISMCDGWEAFQRDMAILAFFERPISMCVLSGWMRGLPERHGRPGLLRATHQYVCLVRMMGGLPERHGRPGLLRATHQYVCLVRMDGRPSRETWPSWPSSSDPSVCVSCQDGWEAFQRDMAVLAFFERPISMCVLSGWMGGLPERHGRPGLLRVTHQYVCLVRMDERPSRETWPCWPSSSDPSICVSCRDGWEAFRRDMAILSFFEKFFDDPLRGVVARMMYDAYVRLMNQYAVLASLRHTAKRARIDLLSARAAGAPRLGEQPAYQVPATLSHHKEQVGRPLSAKEAPADEDDGVLDPTCRRNVDTAKKRPEDGAAKKKFRKGIRCKELTSEGGDLNRSNIALVRKQSKSMQQAAASLFSEAKGYGQQEDAHEFLTDYSKTAKTQRSRVPGHAYFKKIECVEDRQAGTGCVPGRRISIVLPELRYFKPNLGELFRPARLCTRVCQQSYSGRTTRGKGISEASGLLKWLKSFQTMTTHVLCDLLPHLTALSLCFQQPFLKPVEQICQQFLRPQIDDDDAPNNLTQHQSEHHSVVTVVTYLRPPSVPVVQNTDEPTQENTDESTRENTDGPTRQNTDESTQENTDESTQENTDEPTLENTDESTRQNTDEPTRQNTDESIQENTDEPTRENTNKSTRQNTDEPTRQNTDEPTRQNTDESTQENTDESTRQNTDESK
ncbi:hypothetical protein Bbelb_317770 [Branchiostoma belcheri]|nr:hypothetical protein Bbelb_317770 [Branchiostoma belcheri]